LRQCFTTVVAACSAVVACSGHGGTDNYLQNCGLDEAKAGILGGVGAAPLIDGAPGRVPATAKVRFLE
jgi:hypothetical protein